MMGKIITIHSKARGQRNLTSGLLTWLLLGSMLLTWSSDLFAMALFKKGGLSREEKKYLMTLAEDTYRGINHYVDSDSGLPIDNSTLIRDAYTSVTNIGFYIASMAAAVEFGFEKREVAIAKLTKLLNTLEKFDTWKNFPHSWNSIKNHKIHRERFVSTVDLGNYYGGIIVARQYFPEVREMCDQLLKVDWNDLYDPGRKLLYGGYNTQKNRHGDWYYDFLAADSRLVSLLAIAMSGIPVQSWNGLNRDLEERYRIEYLKPGWQGGGIFMAFMTGLFVDEQGTLPGISAANFALAQITHKEKIGSPVWGWSASDSPGYGYLGYNGIRDDIITPHASVLALSYFPKEVVQNLKKLEELGVRPHHIIEGEYADFGFRDAVDTQTGRVTNSYLVLDQTMLFLSLTNFLKDKFVIRQFESYEPVKQAILKIPDYQKRIKEPMTYPVPLKATFKLGSARSYDRSRPVYFVPRAEGVMPMTPVNEWDKAEKITLKNGSLEMGQIMDDKDFNCDISFLWDSRYLYLRATVTDQSLSVTHTGSEIYKSDIVEVYVNPDGKGLVWGRPRDFQIGITPPAKDGSHQTYAWFQNRVPTNEEIVSRSTLTENGYEVIVGISWNFLETYELTKGLSLGVSVAVNDIDEDPHGPAKANWHFKPIEGKIELAKIILK